MKPPWELPLPWLFLSSQCLCHKASAATQSQKQGLSCLVLWSDNLLGVMEDPITSELLLLPLPDL